MSIEWEGTAHRLGYDSELAMWSDLYVTRKFSISTLATKLDVSRNTIRTSLERQHILIRKQGGPNNQKLNVTDDLLEEVRRDGITVVAKRLGLSYTTLYKRLYRIRGVKVSDLHTDDQPKAEELTAALNEPDDDDEEEVE